MAKAKKLHRKFQIYKKLKQLPPKMDELLSFETVIYTKGGIYPDCVQAGICLSYDLCEWRTHYIGPSSSINSKHSYAWTVIVQLIDYLF